MFSRNCDLTWVYEYKLKIAGVVLDHRKCVNFIIGRISHRIGVIIRLQDIVAKVINVFKVYNAIVLCTIQ